MKTRNSNMTNFDRDEWNLLSSVAWYEAMKPSVPVVAKDGGGSYRQDLSWVVD